MAAPEIDDLMALSLDTELQVVEPLHVLASVEIAGQLQAAEDTVMTTSFLRLHDGVPFCYTRVHVPLEIGRRLRELPEMAGLAEPGSRARSRSAGPDWAVAASSASAEVTRDWVTRTSH